MTDLSNVERRNKRTYETIEFLRQLKPGAILYHSWGYEQTNVDFYEVVTLEGSTVTLQEIGRKSSRSNSWASDFVTADRTVRIKEPFKKVVRSPWVRMTSYSSLTLWDGKEIYRSWYA